ncbi:diguanylate cyclase [Methylobacterium sp. 4-46]|uniref:GGDEF domain-containing protein n=1 Tax=unclassified Methylobacterium TaxID=2615210 RepID=UPI000152CF82|nr:MULTISPECIES: GGDEF domain-containing protein [Methylobacterium]ACA18771.1 diguanylate cyclase [Methylobacterium sp. 4-46]WFT78000.1 GGDEF domain-containing protein [Methylobacterium nodulans]
MVLDAATLMLVTMFVTLIVGLLFLLSWRQARQTRALAIWGFAHLLGAAGSALISGRGLIPDALSVGLANAIMLGAYALIWSGARSFEGRGTSPAALLAAPLLWLAACAVPDFYASMTARIVGASGAAALLCGLTAWEIWRGRDEPLVSRAPAAAVVGSEALLYAVRIPATLTFPVPAGNPLVSPWVAVLCFAALLYTVAIAFLFMALAKERLEWEQRLSALSDPLTGVCNRRGLEVRAASLLASGRATLLLFDLDHFKRVNDTYGHAIGDAVLVGFCAAAQALLPPQAVLARLGGEEFACLLPADAAAGPIAETIRRAVAALRPDCEPGLRITVSVGAARGGTSLERLLARADAALYEAKRLGRDRVVWAAGARRGDRALSAAS